MNQAIKIINTVGLMNRLSQNSTYRRKNGAWPHFLGGWPHFVGSLCEKGKNVMARNEVTPVIARSKATKQSHKKAEKKWGLAPFYVGNIYV